MATGAIVAIQTLQGRARPRNADAATHHWFSGTDTLAVAVVDGMGSSPETADTARWCAQTATRYGARTDARTAVLAATGGLRDQTVEFPKVDAVMVVAVARPRQPVVIASVGDAAAFGWQERTLRPLTLPHTRAERLRHEGVQPAARDESIPTMTIARAELNTISLTETFAQLVLLCSDGVHRALGVDEMSALIADHYPAISEDAPDAAQQCVTALVNTAHEQGTDDATAAVIYHPDPLSTPDWATGR